MCNQKSKVSIFFRKTINPWKKKYTLNALRLHKQQKLNK